jgi:glycosyltransferase involved in cell wall biosynthesis
VIPNGLDVDALVFDAAARRRVRSSFGVPDGTYVVGGVGRLETGKRFDALIAALAPLLGPSRRLLLVGDGRERQRLRQLADAAGVADRVIFAGERADIGALLSAMDLFVSPSDDETFGIAVLEALAAALPVLYVQCPALDNLPATAACQISGTVDDLRQAVREHLHAGLQLRGGAATELARYAISACSSAVDALYDRLAAEESRDVRAS